MKTNELDLERLKNLLLAVAFVATATGKSKSNQASKIINPALARQVPAEDEDRERAGINYYKTIFAVIVLPLNYAPRFWYIVWDANPFWV